VRVRVACECGGGVCVCVYWAGVVKGGVVICSVVWFGVRGVLWSGVVWSGVVVVVCVCVVGLGVCGLGVVEGVVWCGGGEWSGVV